MSMRLVKRFLPILAGAALAAGLAGTTATAKADTKVQRLSRAALEDKIRGGWAGQMIGVSFGAPTEFRSNGKIIEGNLPWRPDRIRNALDQDDLYVDMTFAEVMDRIGLQATTEQYGEAFKNTGYSLWHANAAARRLLHQGVKAPLSGHPKYNVHANDIDFQIEADFIGLMTPGLLQQSNHFAERVGRVMNHGDGLYGGLLISAMYAAAFFESDVAKVVEAALTAVPAESGYARIVRDVVTLWRKHPDDWRRAWAELQTSWDKDDACPDGAGMPFNIDARLNGAYVVMGFLYGKGDFARTLDITTRLGQDSDCNPASAAGVLGVMLGYKGIPAQYTSHLPKIANEKFSYTDYSFEDIIKSTLTRALKVITAAGGQVSDQEVTIPVEPVRPPKLEQWNMGKALLRADAGHDGWSWKGDWKEGHEWRDSLNGIAVKRSTTSSGVEATFRFKGTGVVLLGQLTQEGGKADLYLDGKKVGVIDAYIPERTHDNSLWHTYGLKPGKHVLRVVTRNDANPLSKGRQFEIAAAQIYGR